MNATTQLERALQQSKETAASWRNNPARSIARAAIAMVMARHDKSQSAEAHARNNWQFDTDAHMLVRAATTPQNMTDAAALVQVAVAVLPMLAPYSAAAELFRNSLSVTLTQDAGAFTVPGFGLGNVAFVADGAAKPVVQGLSSGGRIDPHKIAGIVVASSELFAQPSIETMMQAFLAESAGPVLDAAVFSNAAGDASKPAGLFNGIAALTATTGGGQGDNMVADLAKMATAIGPVAGAGPIVVVGNVAQMLAVAWRRTGQVERLIAVPTGALPAGTVAMIACNGIVSAFGAPQFETNTQATLSMNDAAVAWPGPPVSSLWQTASVGIKMELPASWARRSASAVAWMQGVNW